MRRPSGRRRGRGTGAGTQRRCLIGQGDRPSGGGLPGIAPGSGDTGGACPAGRGRELAGPAGPVCRQGKPHRHCQRRSRQARLGRPEAGELRFPARQGERQEAGGVGEKAGAVVAGAPCRIGGRRRTGPAADRPGPGRTRIASREGGGRTGEDGPRRHTGARRGVQHPGRRSRPAGGACAGGSRRPAAAGHRNGAGSSQVAGRVGIGRSAQGPGGPTRRGRGAEDVPRHLGRCHGTVAVGEGR